MESEISMDGCLDMQPTINNSLFWTISINFVLLVVDRICIKTL